MGLLSIIRKIKRKEKEMRILMVGLDNSGKTTIVLKINGEDTSVISPTLGFNIKTMTYDKYMLSLSLSQTHIHQQFFDFVIYCRMRVNTK
ncbi:putative small GTPase superfamily, ARF/SAR type, P-loop containing nucleoside triphosphate hydrolase [Helianthus annuus]|nr:putative small GTPase superfamily, ARF/SAR type, P-loop containing nucleoside triphosphate hydrolase [Helianthus annuus]KAJ0707880.1 putative small GTPase superfamily, ARF/SAR type, P-loop containing nucleoside triphosphate hydrolase [Helianthus annuus]KAJ0711858.1 putative small GTPase superfamily, ARF/SAR type, P-loop containing nucleoside triphosphate hydrolase [Helianthus annuus]